ncbi:MAG: hypothetical protein RLZZ124_1832 [Cyanobacteriota bacterium]
MNSTSANRRRTERDEGVKLLFGAAQDVARRMGYLNEGVQASEQNSCLERGRFKLRDKQDHLIIAIPVQQARDMLAFRRELAKEVLKRAGVAMKDGNPASLERGKIRLLSPELRALTWAISSGKRVPYRKRRKLEPLLVVVLLLAGVVPGIVYLLWRWWRQTVFRRELEALVKRWQAAGKPEPAASFFQLYGR